MSNNNLQNKNFHDEIMNDITTFGIQKLNCINKTDIQTINKELFNFYKGFNSTMNINRNKHETRQYIFHICDLYGFTYKYEYKNIKIQKKIDINIKTRKKIIEKDIKKYRIDELVNICNESKMMNDKIMEEYKLLKI